MVKGREENGRLIISLSDIIDSTNAKQVEKEIQEIQEAHPDDGIDLDCDKLQYASSAGLRVFLRLIQKVPDTKLINVHTEMYEILDMTGFTDLADVRKAYRVISVEGCKVIGRGANGEVYRIAPDTIVKVFLNPDALQDIHRERELARLAFVAGVPTAIPYDVVRIEDGGYGSVFELLNAKSFADLLNGGEKPPDEIAKRSIDLLKIIHSKEVQNDILPSMKEQVLSWAETAKECLDAEQYEKLRGLIAAVPEDAHLMHGDYHSKNVMDQNGESLLIDMDKLCHGYPIFELAFMYNAYAGFGLVNPESVTRFLGVSIETAHTLWRRSLEYYLGTADAAAVDAVEAKAKVIALTRLIRHEVRRDGMNREDGRKMIEACRAGLAELLPQVDTLIF